MLFVLAYLICNQRSDICRKRFDRDAHRGTVSMARKTLRTTTTHLSPASRDAAASKATVWQKLAPALSTSSQCSCCCHRSSYHQLPPPPPPLPPPLQQQRRRRHPSSAVPFPLSSWLIQYYLIRCLFYGETGLFYFLALAPASDRFASLRFA